MLRRDCPLTIPEIDIIQFSTSQALELNEFIKMMGFLGLNDEFTY